MGVRAHAWDGEDRAAGPVSGEHARPPEVASRPRLTSAGRAASSPRDSAVSQGRSLLAGSVPSDLREVGESGAS